MLAVVGCAHQTAAPKSSGITEYLDNQTAMTVRVVAEPFIYGHEVPELAVNARDYLSVGAVELDNMGRHRFFLVLVSWSTIDRARLNTPLPAQPDRIEWRDPSRVHEWTVLSHQPRELGAGMPLLEPPVARMGESWIEVKAADLRSLADAPPETIDAIVNGIRQQYTLWRRADGPLREFADSLPADMPPNTGRRRRVGL
jgi:hypothetical protein